MASDCRHILPSGCQCRAYALQGEDLCYFHSRRRRADQKPTTCMDSIEIPLLEDRCAIQVTITQVLRAIVNKTIDRPRASLLLYGLQLALQSVDRTRTSIPVGTVEALSQTSDGEELAADPDEDEDEDDDEDDDDEEEGSDESGDDDSDSDESDSEDDDSDEEDDDAEEEDNEDDDDALDNETTDELIADAKYLQSVSNALDAGDTCLAARLLKE